MMATALLGGCGGPQAAAGGPVLVSGPGFAYDQGLAAKRSAQDLCARRGLRLNPQALGRFAAGAWVFDAGCLR